MRETEERIFRLRLNEAGNSSPNKHFSSEDAETADSWSDGGSNSLFRVSVARRSRQRRPRTLTEAGVVREVPVESVALGLLTAGAPAGAPQADGDVGGTAVAVVRRDIGA